MPPLPESAASPATAVPKACAACGDPLEPEDRFCGHCGHDVSVPAPQPAAAVQPAPSPRTPQPAAATRAAAPPEARTEPVTAVAEPAPAAARPAAAPRPADDGGHAFAGDGDGEESGPTLVLGVHARASDPREEPDSAPTTPAAPPAPDAVCVACGVGGVDADGYCEHCGHAQPRQRDHQEKELEGVAAVSDRGLRHHRNEDAFTVAAASLPDGAPAVSAVVCDGVSTAYRPDDASAVAAATGSESLLGALERGASAEEAMRGALLAAFDAVTALAAEDPAPDGPAHRNAPACTCVSAVVTGPVFTVGWIGDSRAYWIPDDRSRPAARLTEDDSWAARMVAAGLMSEADAYADERAHAITGWLGADAIEVDPHVAAFQPEGPGVIVVCTDGLWNYAESAAEMAEAVPADARARPLHTARALVGLALDGGGHDNVTVAVLPFPAAVSQAAGRTAAPSA